jgi:hypothetical protein
MSLGGTLRTPGGGGQRRAQRLRFAQGFVLASDPNSILQSAVDASNGITVQLQAEGVSRDLPHTGVCWSRPGIYGPDGQLVSPWTPSVRLPICVVQERAKSATNPLLIRAGMLFMDTSSPLTATEGWGYFIDYPSTDLRRVGGVRVSATGVWSQFATTATGRNDHFGAFCTVACGGIGAVQGAHAVGADLNGRPANPLGTNKAIQAAVMTATAGTGWHVGIWAAWAGDNGSNGDSLTFDPQYWLLEQGVDLG